MPRKKTKSSINIYTYSNYRAYLKDLVHELKSIDSKFTMRDFANKAGFSSPSYLKMVIDGQRNITNKSLNKFCAALGIKKKEKEYFSLLIKFNQSLNPDEKNILLIDLEKLRPRVTFSKLKQNQHKYLANDYYAAIREMVLLTDFKDDAKWIAAKCLPRISPAEAREAIDTLLELGLLKRDANGKLIQVDSIVDTGQTTEAAEAFSFHEAVLNKARRYLSHLNQSQRNFSALTFPIPKELSKEIVDRMEKFQDEIMTLINNKNLNYTDVYQLNLQFFPVTAQNNDKDKE